MSAVIPRRPSPFRQKTIGTGVGEMQGVVAEDRDAGKAFQRATIPQLSHQDSLGLSSAAAETPQGKAILDKWDEHEKWLEEQRAAKKKKTQKGQGRKKTHRKKRRRRHKTRRKSRRKRRRTRRKKRRRRTHRRRRRHRRRHRHRH